MKRVELAFLAVAGVASVVLAQTVQLTGAVTETNCGVTTKVQGVRASLKAAAIAANTNAQGVFSLVGSVTALLPMQKAVIQNQTLQLPLPQSGLVEVVLTDISGHRQTLLSQMFSAGELQLQLAELMADVPAGTYQLAVSAQGARSAFRLTWGVVGASAVPLGTPSALTAAVDTLLLSKTNYTSIKYPVYNYSSNMGDLTISRLVSSSCVLSSSSVAVSSSSVVSSSSIAVSSSSNLCTGVAAWSNTTGYSGADTDGNGMPDSPWVTYAGQLYGLTAWWSQGQQPDVYGLIWQSKGFCGATSSSSALSSSSLVLSSSSLVVSSSSVLSSSSVVSSSAVISSSSVALSSSSLVQSSSAVSSSAVCTRTLVSGRTFTVTQNQNWMAGNQQSNYGAGTGAFAVGDSVVIQGRPCSEAVAVAPQVDQWNLYLSSGYPGVGATGVYLEKVKNTGATGVSSSSVVQSSSSVVSSSSALSSSSSVVSGGALSDVLSKAQYLQMFPYRYGVGSGGCRGNGTDFFTYEALIAAAAAYPKFGTEGDLAHRKREVAAFLANISHETTGGGGSWCGGLDNPTSGCFNWGLCYREELGCESQTSCTGYGTSPTGKTYHGRGPIQLSYVYNYTKAGQALGLDLGNYPERVNQDGATSFKTALWFWMTSQAPKPSAHNVMAFDNVEGSGRPPGFGLTINIINGGVEGCGGPINDKRKDRIGFYKRYAGILGVDIGSNVDCDTQASF